MSKQSYDSELARALARPDIDELRKSVEVYHKWSQRLHEGNGSDDDWPDGLDFWFCWDDPDRSLALIMLASATYDDEKFLGVVAAGLLESTLCRHDSTDVCTDEIVERVTLEARKTPRIRWMLSGVWTNDTMRPDHVEDIKQAVGTSDLNKDPLPPRPWA